MNKKAVILTICLVAMSLVLTAPAMAQITYYTDQPTFEAAAPGLTLEDFEETTVVGNTGCDEPIDMNSNDLCFVPGDIQPGLALQTNEGIRAGCPGDCPMVALPPGAVGNATDAVGANFFADTTDVLFTNNNVTAAGMDFSDFAYPNIFDISIYGIGDVLMDTTTANVAAADTFWGVTSNQVITRILIAAQGSSAEVMDNIQFGAPAPPVSVPSMTQWGMIAFMLFAGIGAVYSLRKRRAKA